MPTDTTEVAENSELTNFILDYLEKYRSSTLGNLIRVIHQEERFKEVEWLVLMKSFYVLTNLRQAIHVIPSTMTTDDPERHEALVFYGPENSNS